MARLPWMLLVLVACSAGPPRSERAPRSERSPLPTALRFVDDARVTIEAVHLVLTLAAINDRIDLAYVPPPQIDPRKRLAELREQRRELQGRLRRLQGNREVPVTTRRRLGAVRISRACLDNPLAKDCF